MPPSIEPQLLTADIVESNGALLGLKSKSTDCDCYDNYVRSIQLDIKELAQHPAFKAQVRERLHVSSVTTVQIDITEEDLKIRAPGAEEWISIYSDIAESEDRESIDTEMAQIIAKTRVAYARYLANHRTHSPSTPPHPSPLNTRVSPLRSPVSESELQGRIGALEDTVERLHGHIGRLSPSRESSPRDTLDREALLGHKTLEAAQLTRDLRQAEETIQHLQGKLEHSGREYEERLRKLSEELNAARDQAGLAEKALERAQASHAEETQSLRGERNEARDRVQELEAELRELNESYGSEVEDLSGQIRDLKKENRELRDLLAKQEHRLEEAERRHEEERSHLSGEVEHEREKVAIAERRLQESSQAHTLEMEGLAGRLEEASRTRDQLRVKVGHVEKERDAARAEAVSAHQDLGLERLLHAETSRLAGEEIGALRKRLEETAQSHQRELEHASSQLRDATRQAEHAEETLEEARRTHSSEVASLTSDRDQKQRRVEALEAEIVQLKDTHQRELAVLTEALRKAEEENHGLQKGLVSAHHDLGLERLLHAETSRLAGLEIGALEKRLEQAMQAYQHELEHVSSELRSAISQAERAKETLEDARLAHSSQVASLSSALSQKQERVQALEGEIIQINDTHRRVIERLTAALRQAKQENHALHKGLVSTHQDLGLERLLHAETSRLAGKEIGALRKHLEETEQSHQRELEHTSSQLRDATRQAELAEETLQEARRTHSSEVASLTTDRDQKQRRVQTLEAEVVQLKDTHQRELAVLTEALRKAEEENHGLQKGLVSTHQDLGLERLLHAETSRLAGEEISRLEELLRTATEDYQSHLKRLTAEHASAQERTHRLEDEMQHLSEALRVTRRKLDATTEERDTARQDVVSTHQDLGLERIFHAETADLARKEIARLDTLLKTTEQHYQESRSRAQALEEELAQVNLSYQAQVKDLSTRLDQANRENLRLGEELASAKEEALTLTHRLSTATERYHSQIEHLTTQHAHEQEKLQEELLRLNEAYQSELRSVYQDLGLERLLHAETSRLAGLEIRALTERLEHEATSYQGQILVLRSEVEHTQLERGAEERRLLEAHKSQLSTIAGELEQARTETKQAKQEAERLQALLDKQKRILDEAKRIAEHVVIPRETISIAEDLMGSGVHPSVVDPALKGVEVEAYQVAGDNYFTLPRQLQALIDRNNELQEALAAAEEQYAELHKSGEKQSEAQQRKFSSMLEEIRSEAERMQQQAVAEIEHVKTIAKRDHDQIVKRNRELKAEVAKLKVSVQAYEESDRRQDTQIQRLEGQNRHKQEQVDAARSKISELEAALAEDNKTILAKIDQISALERANRQLGSAIDKLRDELRQEVAYRQSVEKRNEKLTQKLTAAKLRIEVLEEALSSKDQQHQKELDALQEQLDEALLENERLRRDIASLEAENKELRELLERTKGIADELGAEFDPLDMDKSIRAMDLRAFQVVQERDLLKQSLEKLRVDMRQAAEQAQSTQAFLASRATSLEQENERFKTHLAQMLGTSVSSESILQEIERREQSLKLAAAQLEEEAARREVLRKKLEQVRAEEERRLKEEAEMGPSTAPEADGIKENQQMHEVNVGFEALRGAMEDMPAISLTELQAEILEINQAIIEGDQSRAARYLSYITSYMKTQTGIYNGKPIAALSNIFNIDPQIQVFSEEISAILNSETTSGSGISLLTALQRETKLVNKLVGQLRPFYLRIEDIDSFESHELEELDHLTEELSRAKERKTALLDQAIRGVLSTCLSRDGHRIYPFIIRDLKARLAFLNGLDAKFYSGETLVRKDVDNFRAQTQALHNHLVWLFRKIEIAPVGKKV